MAGGASVAAPVVVVVASPPPVAVNRLGRRSFGASSVSIAEATLPATVDRVNRCRPMQHVLQHKRANSATTPCQFSGPEGRAGIAAVWSLGVRFVAAFVVVFGVLAAG